ncbi:YciI family protein [Streptococcus troglodytae]|uniref:YCII-related domain-containing protein n=1 Tax=Streptococcus troglodytae TaxID=1111760 RepID=A0A1L7LJV3_9STRE|nr:YciI family protein [Streptococcus troglodytae]BAQ24495.1 putative uncharacterized protein [Streptococcus troglodytae]
MFLINITIKDDLVPKEEAESRLAGHRAWFTKQFEKGSFLIVGPYKDKGMAGLIIAQADSRAAIESIITQDAYYPDYASYDISEFTANMVANNITAFKGK